MKNNYEIKKDKVVIHLSHKGETVETEISLDKLELADSFPNLWHAGMCSTRKKLFVTGHITENGEQKSVLLHRWINEVFDKNIEVDHYDNNPLNNLNENLRLVTREENLQNRTVQANNTSGYRGVSFHKGKNKWQATVSKNKKLKHLGLFNTAEEANEAVVKWRKENYAFSKEANEVNN